MTSPEARGSDACRPPWYDRREFWEVFIGAVALALFAQSVGFGWVYDDQMEIVMNAFVHSLDHLPEIFSTTVWAGSGMETYLYRPLALVSYALNHQIAGLEPWSYHVVNVALHATVSILVFRLGLLWGLPVMGAGVGGLLFAVHPTHVEVVAAVFGRKDLLATLFVLAMVLSHRSALTRGGWRLAVPALAFAGALFSKEVGMVGLPLVVAQDWVLEGDRGRFLRNQRVPGLYIAYLAVLLLYLLVRNHVTGGMGVPETSFFDNPLVGASPVTRLATALVVLARGILLLALPLALSPDYSFRAIPLVQSPGDPRLLGALLLFGLLAASLGWLGRKRARFTLGWAWYGVAIFPTSNLLLTVGTIFGERFLYLPSVAFCLLAGAALYALAQRSLPASAALGTVVALLMGVQTVRYSQAWTDDLTLFRWAVTQVPNSTKANHKLGEEELRAGHLGNAIRSLRRALEIAPENEFATVTMAQARQQIGDLYLPPPSESRPPPQPLPKAPPPPDPDILYVLGQLSAQRGEVGRAATYWEEGIRLEPEHAETLADLAVIRISQADTARGIELLQKAVRAKPTLASPWLNLARLYLATGDGEAARAALRRFLEVAGPPLREEILWARRALQGISGG